MSAAVRKKGIVRGARKPCHFCQKMRERARRLLTRKRGG